MPASGDVVDLGVPHGPEAVFVHPAVLVTAQRILDAGPSVVQGVPFTTTIRGFHSELVIEPDASNGSGGVSARQCQHLRGVSPGRRCWRGSARPSPRSSIFRDGL